jgi:hypothetical protein
MFPIRSLTPQQASGNALATGFNLDPGYDPVLSAMLHVPATA